MCAWGTVAGSIPGDSAKSPSPSGAHGTAHNQWCPRPSSGPLFSWSHHPLPPKTHSQGWCGWTVPKKENVTKKTSLQTWVPTAVTHMWKGVLTSHAWGSLGQLPLFTCVPSNWDLLVSELLVTLMLRKRSAKEGQGGWDVAVGIPVGPAESEVKCKGNS